MKAKVITTIMIMLFLASMLSMAFVAPVAATPDSSIVGLWHLDEGSGNIAFDSSDNDNDGTLTNMDLLTCWVPGKFGMALSFDGTDDYVNIPSSPTVNLGDQDFTIKAWFKTSVTTGTPDPYNFRPIISNYHSTPEILRIYLDGVKYGPFTGIIKAYTRDSSDAMIILDSGVTGNDGNWHHVALVRDTTANTIKLYVDGVEKDSKSDTRTGDFTAAGPDQWRIGSEHRPAEPLTTAYWQGLIDEVRIYDVALSASEIQLEYEMVDKTLSASEGELGDVVHVTIEAFNPSDDYDLVVKDTIPEGFHYIIGSFMVDGVSATPTIDGHVISYTIGEEGVHVIEFNVKVDEAKSWDDMTVCNVVSAFLDGVPVGEDEEYFVIHPFEELQKGARPVLFSDDFSDPDYTEAQWTLLSGPWDGGYTMGGTWEVEADEFSAEAGPMYVATAVAGSTSWTDYSVTVRAKDLDASGVGHWRHGIAVRWTDYNNWVIFHGTGHPDEFYIYKRVGGFDTLLWHGGTSGEEGTWYTYRIEAIGSTFNFYVTGGAYASETLLTSLEITDSILQSGAIALLSWANGYPSHTHFDDVLVTGPLVPVKEKTNVQWAIEIEVTNPFSYTMTDVVITDRFGAEIEIDPPFPFSITHPTASYYTKGTSAKVFLTWDIGDLLPGETARLIILVSTDINPAGKQEYTRPDIYELNSGATLKFIDPDQNMQLSAVTAPIYVTVLPAEDPA